MTQEALKMSQEALAGLKDVEKQVRELIAENKALKEALREHAMREVQRLGQEIEQECWCTTCRPITMADMRFVVCPDCGNKRCPKANDHRNACTNSNEVGQEGSSWEHVKPLAQHDSVQAKPEPEQEPVKYSDYEPDGVHHNKPPQRTWVGLTFAEICECESEYANVFARNIEAKLKEKNT